MKTITILILLLIVNACQPTGSCKYYKFFCPKDNRTVLSQYENGIVYPPVVGCRSSNSLHEWKLDGTVKGDCY